MSTQLEKMHHFSLFLFSVSLFLTMYNLLTYPLLRRLHWILENITPHIKTPRMRFSTLTSPSDLLEITSSCAPRHPRRCGKTSCGQGEEERGMGSAPIPPSYTRRTPKTSFVRERERGLCWSPERVRLDGPLGQDRRTRSITYATIKLKGLFPRRERQKKSMLLYIYCTRTQNICTAQGPSLRVRRTDTLTLTCT